MCSTDVLFHSFVCPIVIKAVTCSPQVRYVPGKFAQSLRKQPRNPRQPRDPAIPPRSPRLTPPPPVSVTIQGPIEVRLQSLRGNICGNAVPLCHKALRNDDTCPSRVSWRRRKVTKWRSDSNSHTIVPTVDGPAMMIGCAVVRPSVTAARDTG